MMMTKTEKKLIPNTKGYAYVQSKMADSLMVTDIAHCIQSGYLSHTYLNSLLFLSSTINLIPESRLVTKDMPKNTARVVTTEILQ